MSQNSAKTLIFDIFLPRIQVLEGLENAGDLRFHSLTLYALVRALRPSLVVETGVAHGKSSALILLALSHNGHGRLVSFDLPPAGDLADGSKTSLSGRQVGWIVPEYLRTTWELNLVDSVTGLLSMFSGDAHSQPDRSESLERVDLFFHDSLHTYDHPLAELEAVNRSFSKNFVIVADNLEMESGLGFETFCQRENLKVETFGNLGGSRGAASSEIK